MIVTGGTGYIGSHTAVELQLAGHDVVLIDNFCNSKPEVADAIQRTTGIRPELVQLDLCDASDTMELFRAVKPKAVIHFAALKAVGESVEQPLAYYRNNIGSTLSVAEACIASGTRNIVFSSSCAVYGDPGTLPIAENAPDHHAKSPYAHTKQICEAILEDLCKTGVLSCISLRYFNPVGAHFGGHIGEQATGEINNLFPLITQTAIGKRDCITLFGNDYNTPDGTCIRDYIHVADVALAHVKAMDHLFESGSGLFDVFNIGTGKGFSVLEILNAFEATTGIKVNAVIGPRRQGDTVAVYADNRKALRELGWSPKYGLSEMIQSAWAWEQILQQREQTAQAT
ncbi:MAG: UDP-glucose 4-epimerase GalE [Bacteroidota bacterium]